MGRNDANSANNISLLGFRTRMCKVALTLARPRFMTDFVIRGDLCNFATSSCVILVNVMAVLCHEKANLQTGRRHLCVSVLFRFR